MARPTKPVVGGLVPATFGQALVNYAGEAMEFIRLPATGITWDLNGVVGTGAYAELELTRLPVNTDGRIVYALLGTICRASTAGGNIVMTVKRSATATGLDGIAYSFGTASRGGAAGPFMCRLGGANGRSVWWQAAAASNLWIMALGYWRTVM